MIRLHTLLLFLHRWVGVLALGLALPGGAWAQVGSAGLGTGLTLRAAEALDDRLPGADGGALPTFLSAQALHGRPDQEVVLDGQAQLRRADTVIQADRLEYDQVSDRATATGQVQVDRAGNRYSGPRLQLRLDAFEGFFEQPTYQLQRQGAHGQAQRVDFLDADRSVVQQASYTTCRRSGGPEWLPDWVLQASQLRLDQGLDRGEAIDAVLRFKDVPVLGLPYLSFPLSDRPQSGLLPPTLGLDSQSGLTWAQPLYWSIAPNRDATFTPTLMTRRGLALGTELRYLEQAYEGTWALDWMPIDRLRSRARWGAQVQHRGALAAWGLPLALSVNLNRVSDDDYWRDFSNQNAALGQRLLANDVLVSGAVGAWTTQVRSLRWQTLQDPLSPIIPPYDRLPQLNLSRTLGLADGHAVDLEADYTRFQSDRARTGQPDAQRSLARVAWHRTWGGSAVSITPRLQVHATAYQFDTPLATGAQRVGRVVPTLSLDASLAAERDWHWQGRDWLQTLEPRLFYVHTPWRDQNTLPNYDAGASDFNLATVFTENAFVGNDRISDTHALTLGLTSRLIDPQTGVEAARLGVAQRLRLSDQDVVLPGGQPERERLSDLLVGGAVQWSPLWRLEGTVQFKPATEQWMRASVGASYRPGPYRSVSAAYRYQRGTSEQVDLGWQWPLARAANGARWYSVGRLNYSMAENRLLNTLVGLEYDAGCWLGRVVLERVQTSTAAASQRIMAQLEFVGFTRLGVNPLKSLQDNIPGYEALRGSAPPAQRFGAFD